MNTLLSFLCSHGHSSSQHWLGGIRSGAWKSFSASAILKVLVVDGVLLFPLQRRMRRRTKVRMPSAPPIPIRAPRSGVTLRPCVFREGRAWAGPSSPPPISRVGPTVLHSLFEALIVILNPGSKLERENVGLEDEKLAITMPFSLAASK